MGSPITFSGFNNIDFTTVLNALMKQESAPLTALTQTQGALTAENSAYGVLATKLGTLDAAAAALADPATVAKYQAASSNAAAIGVTAGAGVSPGQYDIVVTQLARAQITVSNTTAPDADTTQVATGGSLVIGGVTVSVAAGVTLAALADQINQTSGIGVTASVLQSAPAAYRLVLTSRSTGQANGFTVANNLTGGSGLGFIDTNGDGVSGDSIEDNAVSARNASLTVNNTQVVSATNTLTGVISGATLSLQQEDPAHAVTITVGRDDGNLTTRVQTMISAYNDLVAFANDQRTADAGGTPGTLARDPVLSGVRNQLRNALLATYPGGIFGHLAEVGVSPDQHGVLTIDTDAFSAAVAAHPDDVTRLFAGTSNDGVFATAHTLVTQYTQAGGFIPSAQTQLNNQLSRVAASISALQDRLAITRAALQKEFTAADLAIAQLNSQSSSLSAFGAAMANSPLSSSTQSGSK
jgi:flagellar hook-associated protein 2